MAKSSGCAWYYPISITVTTTAMFERAAAKLVIARAVYMNPTEKQVAILKIRQTLMLAQRNLKHYHFETRGSTLHIHRGKIIATLEELASVVVRRVLAAVAHVRLQPPRLEGVVAVVALPPLLRPPRLPAEGQSPLFGRSPTPPLLRFAQVHTTCGSRHSALPSRLCLVLP